MKLLLKEDVHGLGSCGDQVEVKTLDDIAAESNPNDYDECLACQ